MVAIVTGAGLGTERSSGNVLGAPGQLGSALLGRGNEAVTVNAATGNLILSHQDEFLVGRGPDSAINRVYNSQGAFTDDNADNWALGIQRRLHSWSGTPNVAGATVTRRGADGTDIVYSYDVGRGLYVTTEGSGAYDTLQNVGHWIWKDGDSQALENYDSGGTLLSLFDSDGNYRSYQYTLHNGAWRLSRVQSSDGDYTDFTWSGNNLASLTTSYTDTQSGSVKTLTRTRYTYNGGNWLTKVTVDLSPEDGSIADGRVYETTYGYDGGNRVNSIAQTDGTLLTFTYDGSGRVVSFTQAVENSVTRTTTLTYSSLETRITDPSGYERTFYYSSSGQLTRIDEFPPLAGGEAIVTVIEYTASGEVQRVRKFDGAANLYAGNFIAYEAYSYDNNGNMLERVDGSLHTKRWTYGSRNELLTATQYTGIDPDGLGGAVPSGGMTTRYVHDSELHLRFAVSAEGRVTEYRYDGFGNLVSEIGYAANSVSTAGLAESYSWPEQDLVNWVAGIADKSTTIRTDTTYDFRGNVAMVTSYARVDVAGNGIPDEGTSRTLYVYDQFGSLLSKRRIAGSASPSMTDLSVYGAGNLSVASAGTIAGKPANLYTVQASGVWAAVYNGFTANEGDVVTYSFTVKGTAGDSAASIGLYGDGGSYWGSNEVSIARIVSGPGSISQDLGALWSIGGLSTTQETRIEITRLYRQSESAGVYLYVDRPNGVRAGASLIVSDPILSKAATAVETYAYDGMGRMIRFTDAKGVGTWTTYLDAQGRTAVTHANGLVQANAYNRAGELVSAAETRGGAFDAAYVNSDIATWNTNTTRTSAGLLDGAPATQITISSGQTYGYNYTAIPVAAGDTITWTISLKALGNSTAHALGLWGGGTYWGSTNLSSARIISGPGSIAQHPTSSGLFDVSGLSGSEATRIEITRTFLQAEVAYPHFYTQGATSSAGEGAIVSANSLVIAHAGANGGIALNTNDFSIENWSLGSVTSAPAGALGGAPAVQYTVAGSASGQSQQAVAPNYLDARAGDTVTASIVLMGTSTSGSAAFGVYGHTTGWGYAEDSAGTARIVSGPGTIARYAGNGLWAVTGLSATQETRIEITRTFLEDETASVRLYPDIPNGSILGHSIIAGAPSITRRPGEITSFKYDAAGNVRIARDPGGYRTFYFYDNLRRKVGEVAADGAVTEYKYDAADRLIATMRYVAAYSAAQVAGLYDVYGNPTAVTFATVKSQIGTSAADRWEWNVYDKAGRLIETINRAGAVVAFEYDGAGRVVRTSRYANVLASGTVEGFVTSPPTSPVYPASYVGLDRVTRNFYDNDGLLIATLDAECYLTEYLYDKVGRQVEAVSYYGQPATAYVLNGTLAQLKSTQPSHANDARNYTIYDGRGLVAALIDGEGGVTRFAYDAAGNVIEEVRGQKVTPGTAYTLATLPAASGQLQVVNYLRNVLGQVTSQIEAVSGGNLTSTLAYGWAGDVTVATDARGNATNRYYDARGRLVIEEVPVGAGTWASTRYEYDSRGNLVKVIDARGNASYHYYDTRGRLVLAIDAEGYATRTTYNAFGEVASVTRYYNRASGIGNVGAQPTVTADARDATTSFAYDIAGLVASTTDANGTAEYFYHNAFGEKLQWNNKIGGATGYSYNRIGQLYYEYTNKTVVRSDGGTQASGNYNKLYHYDARGNRILQVEGYSLEERRDTVYAYDRANRLVSKQLPSLLVFNPANETQSTVTPTETYKYDARGNLIETVDPAGGRTLSYADAVLLRRGRSQDRRDRPARHAQHLHVRRQRQPHHRAHLRHGHRSAGHARRHSAGTERHAARGLLRLRQGQPSD